MTENELHSTPRCDAALTDAFSILGKRWSGVILGLLSENDARFADLSRGLGGDIGGESGISDSVLSSRLTELGKLGLVERQVTSGPPVSVNYTLTESGRALIPSLNALASWARTHLPRPS